MKPEAVGSARANPATPSPVDPDPGVVNLESGARRRAPILRMQLQVPVAQIQVAQIQVAQIQVAQIRVAQIRVVQIGRLWKRMAFRLDLRLAQRSARLC